MSHHTWHFTCPIISKKDVSHPILECAEPFKKTGAQAWFCAAFVQPVNFVTPFSHARARSVGYLVAFRSSFWQ